MDYVPWKLSDDVGCRSMKHGEGHCEVSQDGGEQTGVNSSCINEGGQRGDLHTSVARRVPDSLIASPRPRVDSLGGRCRIQGWGSSDQFGEGGIVNTTRSDAISRDDRNARGVRCAPASDESSSDKFGGDCQVQTALHGVLDALRRVRAVRESLP